MSKKLISLVLVLALAQMASAIQWVGTGYLGGTKAWEDTANWDVGRLPAATDTATIIQRSDQTGSKVLYSSVGNVGIKPQIKAGPILLEIAAGAVMNCDGSLEQKATTGNTVTVNVLGTLQVAQKITQATGTYKFGTANNGSDILNIWGTVRVKGQGTNGTSDIQVGQGSNTGAGTAVLTIYSTGLLDVDTYAIRAGVGQIRMVGGGVMKIKGNKVAQVTTDMGASRIVGIGDVIGSLNTYYVAGEDTTYVVPEPATVAMLGLGSLMLLRRKR